MTPFAKTVLLAVMALVVLVLLVRMVLRWWRDRQALKSFERPPRVASQDAQAAAPQPTSQPEPVPPSPVRVKAYKTPQQDTARTVAPATKTAEDTALRQVNADEVPYADTSDYSYGPVTPMLASLLPESDEKKSKVKRALKNAGYFTPHAWHNLAATRYLGIIIPLVAFGLMLVFLPQQFEWLAIGGLVMGPILGYSLPSLLVQSQAGARLKDIEQGMPDMLDMLNMCVSQGMTLPRAMERVGKELRGVYPALSQELSIVSDQARIGGVQQGLANFADRVDLPDVHSFTSLMIQTERLGTSVSDALSDYSDNMRESLEAASGPEGELGRIQIALPDRALPDAGGVPVPPRSRNRATARLLHQRRHRRHSRRGRIGTADLHAVRSSYRTARGSQRHSIGRAESKTSFF